MADNDKKFCITIHRSFGSGGRRIGKALAGRLGIEFYDRDLSRLSSEYSGINERLFVQYDENVKNRLFHKYSPADLNAIVSPDDEKFVSDDNLFRLQAQVIRNLAERENCIIIGRCAGYILSNDPHVVRVFINAPLDDCIKNVEENYGLSWQDARRLILKTDENRRAYYKYYTGGKQWDDAFNYDLSINTASIGFEKAADLILDYMKIRGLL
jgi:hypothetical protein